MATTSRKTIPLHQTDIDRMQRHCERVALSNAKLLACFLALPNEQIDEIVQRMLPVITEERRVVRKGRREQNAEAIRAISALTPEQISAILAAATQKG